MPRFDQRLGNIFLETASGWVHKTIFCHLLPTLTRTELANWAPGGCVLGKTRLLTVSRSRFSHNATRGGRFTPTARRVYYEIILTWFGFCEMLRVRNHSLDLKHVYAEADFESLYTEPCQLFSYGFPQGKKNRIKHISPFISHQHYWDLFPTREKQQTMWQQHASMSKTTLIGQILCSWFFCPCCMCAQSSWR